MPTSSFVAPLSGGSQPAGAPRTTRFRLASPNTAIGVALLDMGLMAAVIALSLLNHDPDTELANNIGPIVIALAFAAVGFVVATQQPHNAIGWILLASAFCFLGSEVGTIYAVLDYRLHHGALPLGWLAVSLSFLWVPWLMLMAPPILLFPAGMVPSPRWRWSLCVYVFAAGVATIGGLMEGALIGAGRSVHILLNGSPNTNNLQGFQLALSSAVALIAVIPFVLWLAWTVRLLASYRRTKGDIRQQLKWLMGGGLVTIIAVGFIILGPPVGFTGGVGSWLYTSAFLLCILGLPIGLGVGILKYRLYDVDRIISRTLSYAIVTGLLIGVYIGLVTLATRVLPFSSPLGVAASTLVAVALFNPLRRRVQRLVDRRFNRARYDAEATVAAFAHRVRNDVDLDVVSSEFVRAVQSSVEPAHVSLWLRPTSSGS
jgi:hypothetical protein